jgi:hypothetical protein
LLLLLLLLHFVPFFQQLVSLFRLTHLHRIAFPLLQNGTNDFRRGKEVLLFSRVKASTALATATKCTLKLHAGASKTTVVDYFHGPCAVLTGTWAGWRSRGFGSVVNAKAKVKGPLAERLLRPRSNALPTFHSSSMVTHHSGGRNAAIFLKERFVRGRTI